MEFKKLSDVTLVEEAAKTANIIIEEDGEIKKLPRANVGGGLPTAIFKDSDYNTALQNHYNPPAPTAISLDDEGVEQVDVSDYSIQCINMTFDEAYELLESGNPLCGIFMGALSGTPENSPCQIFANGKYSYNGTPSIDVIVLRDEFYFYFTWFAEGIYPADEG